MKRIWHPWNSWECYWAGMFDGKTGLSPDEAKLEYAEFLRDTRRFRRALKQVLRQWPVSCEHFLSNESINRVAWLGQASMCIATGVNYTHRAGFKLLTEHEQRRANAIAEEALFVWLANAEPRAQLCLDLAPQGLPG